MVSQVPEAGTLISYPPDQYPHRCIIVALGIGVEAMAISKLKNWKLVAVNLFIFLVFPVAGLFGQDKPLIAPPARSDSYAIDEKGRKIRVQHRHIVGENLLIAGVNLALKGDFFANVFNLLGKFTTVASGDASTGLEEACYQSSAGDDPTLLIFGEGEVDRSFILTSDHSTWKWKIPCKRSRKISINVATSSGLHLGQTQDQVIAILGLPTWRSRNNMNGRDVLKYELEAKRKMNAQEIAALLQDE